MKMEIDNQTVVSRRAVGLAFVAFIISIAFSILFQPLDNAVAYSATDDGLYYPRLAQNICGGIGCTYDGITFTNGFHPLWLVSLLPIYGVLHDPWIALRAVYVWVFLLQAASLGLFAYVARRCGMTLSGGLAAVFILVLNLRSVTIFFSLLESPLVLLLYLVYLAWCIRRGVGRFNEPRWAFLTGLLIGLCFLARIDSFILAFAYALVFVFRKKRVWKTALFSALGCLMLVVPYLVWNYRSFGHLETVSAWQKSMSFSPANSWHIVSSWYLYQFIPRVQYVFGLEKIPPVYLLYAMVLTALAGLAFVLTGWRRERLFKTIKLFPEYPVFVILHTIFIVLFAPMEAAASAWYLVPEITLIALVVGICLPDYRLLRMPLIPVAIVLLVVAQMLFYPKFLQRKAMTFAKIEMAEYLREHTSKDVRCAMFDSGIVSYFSQRDFVGINGLIGDFELGQLVKDRRYRELAERYGIDLLVLDSPSELVQEFSGNIAYQTRIKTKFENFSEGPKPFVAYSVTPAEFEQIWKTRYKGLR